VCVFVHVCVRTILAIRNQVIIRYQLLINILRNHTFVKRWLNVYDVSNTLVKNQLWSLLCLIIQYYKGDRQ
jgi:hypothetical protein